MFAANPATVLTFTAIIGAGVVIDERTLTPIGSFGAALALAWFVGKKVQKVDDNIDVLQNRMKTIEGKLDKMPCKLATTCIVNGQDKQ